MPKRIAGTVTVRLNGDVLKIVGNVEYNSGRPMREELSGFDDPLHGYKETPQAAFISGTGRIVEGFSVINLVEIVDATVEANLANGTTVSVFEAFYSGEGTAGSEEATIGFKFIGPRFSELTA